MKVWGETLVGSLERRGRGVAAVAFAMLLPAAMAAQGEDLDVVFGDGFETGNLAQWPAASIDGGDLSASGTAALVGAYGLQAIVNDTTGLYVQDDLPLYGPSYRYDDEAYYQASFRFDPNGFDPGEAQGALRTRIFIAFQDDPLRRLFAIVLRRREGQFALMGRVREDDEGHVDTGFFDITDDPHLIEVTWHRSRGPNANDGLFRLAIDGVVASTLENLDNSMSGLDFTRVGALSVKNGASGTLYWDAFLSSRDLAPARTQLVINEVDYDQPGDDRQEFVELYNPGPAPAIARGFFHIVMVDGASHNVHGFNGNNGRLAVGQYMVFASRTVTVAAGAWRQNLVLDQDNIGNGAPDSVVLVYESDTGCVVLDALSYEGPMSVPLPFGCGYASLVEGTLLSEDIEDSDLIPGSLIRLPNGSDTDDAATDWTFSSTPTPGAPNVP